MRRPRPEPSPGGRPGLLLLLLLALTAPLPAADGPASGAAPAELRIGILALRGKDRAQRRWQATADYLAGAVPGHRFAVVPLDFDELEPAVAERRIDFVLANSYYYVGLERRHRVSRIATLRNRSPAGSVTHFGGLVFTRAEEGALTEIADLEGRSLAAVDPRSLGGYLAALGELARRGLDADDLAEVRFHGTHDAVVRAVLDGRADAGTVRSDTLERMAQEGRLELARVRVLSPVTDPPFPFRRSTPLYPEWPFAALAQVPQHLRDRVAMALLGMPDDHPAAVSGLNEGWSVPANYQPVHELLRLLRLPPYEPDRHPSVLDALSSHRAAVISAVVLVTVLSLLLLRLRARNRSLLATQLALRATQADKEKDHARLQAAFSSLAAKEELLDKVTDTALDGILMLDDKGRVAYANSAAASMLGYTEEELFGIDLHERVVAPELRARARDGFGVFAHSGNGPVVGDTRALEMVRKDGSRLPVELSVSALEMHGRWHAIGVVRDISARLRMEQALAERKAREEQMRQLAFMDGLTNLPNRSLFRLRLEQMAHLAHREGKGFALLFLDLDRFKAVNDTLGHAAGDRLLQQVAARLGRQFRESDTVARLGGDEFTAIAYDTATPEAAARVAERALSVFEQPFHLEGRELAVGASLGISLFPLSSHDPDILLRQADSAMYDAKGRGGTRFSLYGPEMAPATAIRAEPEDALRRALHSGGLRLRYRPLARIPDGEPIGLEAVPEWDDSAPHPETPARLLSRLADLQLARETGRWLLAEACRQIAHGQSVGGRRAVAVRLTPLHLEGGHLLDDVDEVIGTARIEPARLTLDITETALLGNMGYAADLLGALARLGVRLRLGDFGAGHASLDLVKGLPFVEVGLSAGLVRDLPVDPGSRALAGAVVALAHGTGRTVVAEGVESQAQMDCLAGLGCDAAQGDLLGRPRAIEDLAVAPLPPVTPRGVHGGTEEVRE